MDRFFPSFRYWLIIVSLFPVTYALADSEVQDPDLVTPYEFWPLFMKMLLLLGLMLGVLLGASYFLKRLMAQRATFSSYGSQIEIVERKPLDAKTTLYLFRIGDKEVFAAEHTNGFSSLAHWKQENTQIPNNK